MIKCMQPFSQLIAAVPENVAGRCQLRADDACDDHSEPHPRRRGSSRSPIPFG